MIETKEAYPLYWPVGYNRTPNSHKTNAPFQTAFAQARDAAINELKKMGAKNIIISSNVPLRKDGIPYAVPFGESQRVTADTGIAVYFDWNNDTKVLCCDAYVHLDDNMQAIRKTLEALRGIDRWKASDILSRVFAGFAALPAATIVPYKDIWKILDLEGMPANVQVVHDQYRIKAKQCHPDTGGTAEDFTELQNAYKQALSQFN